VLIHGRLDLGSPLGTAWELARVWHDAELIVIPDSGHTGSDAMRREIVGALDRFAREE
jgi:proline iminopeptidase